MGQDGRRAWPLWRTLEEQVKLWQRHGVGNNVIPIIGHGNVRTEVMGWHAQPAISEQESAMAYPRPPVPLGAGRTARAGHRLGPTGLLLLLQKISRPIVVFVGTE